jgi:hypothetical protein
LFLLSILSLNSAFGEFPFNPTMVLICCIYVDLRLVINDMFGGVYSVLYMLGFTFGEKLTEKFLYDGVVDMCYIA